MLSWARRGLPLLATAAWLLGTGCGPEEQPCSDVNPCLEGMACTPAGECIPALPLGVREPRLADGVRGAAYADEIHAEGGIPPYSFALDSGPAWLRLAPGAEGAAELEGVPDELCSDRLVRIELGDSSWGDGQRVIVELALTVTDCTDGALLPCAYAEEGRCLSGTSTCLEGAWGVCAGGQPSTDAARCGPACAACGSEADACLGGVCACGAGLACFGGDACCEGVCVDLASDAEHCGGCAIACAERVGHALTPLCLDGLCAYDACAPGFLDCDFDRTNGCETPSGDGDCGACGRDCGAYGTCQDGQCACVSPHGDCDASLANGCETLLSADLEHCGLCTRSCLEVVRDATGPFCQASLCDYAECVAGHADCDGDRGNGCETALWELEQCGVGCDALSDCALETVHAQGVTCDHGACDFTTCDQGWESCDGDRENGCEALLWDLRRCRDDCSPLGYDCTEVVQHANQVSCHGTCDYADCDPGFGDCDENRVNGCEDHLWSVDRCRISCAQLGTNCRDQLEHTSEVICTALGTCDYVTCDPAFGDCDGDRGNGCERLLWTVTNCGQTCAGGPNCELMVQHAVTVYCTEGVCDHGLCEAGFQDCDFDRTNGCEASLLTSPYHCGECFHQCTALAPYCCSGLCSMDPC